MPELNKKLLTRALGLTALTALLAACSQQEAPTTHAPDMPGASAPALTDIARSGALEYLRNELVVGYSTEEALQEAAKTLGGTVVDRIPEIRPPLIRIP